jgi:hypothetical protein
MVGLLLVALCGCIKVKDELTINADGSGTVRIETQSSLPSEYAEGLGLAGQVPGGGGIYPPTSEVEARKYFPAKDFTVTVKPQKPVNGSTTTIIEASFKDINALLVSPYGRAHQLSVRIANGSLVVRGVTGLEAAARLAEMRTDNNPELAMLPGLAELKKQTNDMRAEFRIALPNPVSSANGTQDGRSAVWIVERAKYTNGLEFAQQLGTPSEAKCPADGLKMNPVTPARLGLAPFAELAAVVLDTGKGVDTNKIAAAAKFVPYGLTITRSLDLSGAGGAQPDAAELTGAVLLPPELTPQKWGEPELDEAVDAKGNDLKPGNSDQERFLYRAHSWSSRAEEMDEADTATNTAAEHRVTLTFRPPDWKVAEIARIKGTVTLQYFGGARVVKLTNAIPANWIADMSKMMGGIGGGSFDSSPKPLSSETLASLGLSLSMNTAAAQGSLTMLMLQVKGQGAALTDAQVFDAEGRPWPTFFEPGDSSTEDGEACQIMVAGNPRPPLSLAFLASGNGATVNVPMRLEHVSF